MVYRIAWDLSSGLAYLHSVSPPLVHRDLKSPNGTFFFVGPFRLLSSLLLSCFRIWSPELLFPYQASFDELSRCYRYQPCGQDCRLRTYS
jgi:serine/threonine protein kinase